MGSWCMTSNLQMANISKLEKTRPQIHSSFLTAKLDLPPYIIKPSQKGSVGRLPGPAFLVNQHKLADQQTSF